MKLTQIIIKYISRVYMGEGSRVSGLLNGEPHRYMKANSNCTNS